MRIFVLVTLSLCCSGLLADNCKFEKQITKKLDLSSASELRIAARAGDLRVEGSENTQEASIRGRACASTQEWLDEMDVQVSEGKTSEITVLVPDIDSGLSYSGNRYVYIDLELTVPNDLPLDVKDSSGDMRLENISQARVSDSSGDIEIYEANGPLLVSDSSGDIKIRSAADDVSVEDSSGDIDVVGVFGDVTIENDSSGDIDVREIEGNVHVIADSSGGIDIRDVSLNVTVDRDSSGDIDVSNIEGDFTVHRDGGGSISSRQVAGIIDIPKDKL